MNKPRVDTLSLTAVSLEMLSIGQITLASATGFLFREKDKIYLITNWHNVTGIHPTTKKRIDEASPTHIRFSIPERLPGAFQWREYKISLYDISTLSPQWMVHKKLDKGVDVVALELFFDDKINRDSLVCINDLEYDDISLSVSDDIFILGFPIGELTKKLPIWKRGSIASEPELNFEDLPRFYIDSATRKGMSGSPVIMRRNGIHGFDNGTANADSVIGQVQSFCGIYSGRIASNDEFAAQIGIVWKSQVINDILRDNLKETIYYPETSFS